MDNNNNNGSRVRFGVERRHRGVLSPRNQQYILLVSRRDEREKVLEVPFYWARKKTIVYGGNKCVYRPEKTWVVLNRNKVRQAMDKMFNKYGANKQNQKLHNTIYPPSHLPSRPAAFPSPLKIPAKCQHVPERNALATLIQFENNVNRHHSLSASVNSLLQWYEACEYMMQFVSRCEGAQEWVGKFVSGWGMTLGCERLQVCVSERE